VCVGRDTILQEVNNVGGRKMKRGDLVHIISRNEQLKLIGIVLGKCYFNDLCYNISYDGKIAEFDTRFWSFNIINGEEK
jgi:hypothetical protein